ncbi:MAG: carboxypeptidase regulatory-like domain-containing protein [Acidobacteria bacterium]|nr:carboxypeptidase regulatory-like domain-containing protein [Acidobacteriota bacterium]
MRTRLALLLALCLLALPLTAGDPPMTAIRVEVKTYAGRPVDRASVIVRFVAGRSVVKLGKKINTSWQLKSNQEGIAKFPPLPQGTILVQVIATGYQTYGQTFEINEAERTVEVKLNAPQPQVSAHQ